jgi:hypothetical protein
MRAASTARHMTARAAGSCFFFSEIGAFIIHIEN